MFPARIIFKRAALLHSIITQSQQRYSKKVTQAGVGLRRKFLLGPNEQTDDVDWDDLEADFMDVHKSHKQHTRDMQEQHEREKYLIVGQKYFKEKYPNFLTWHDKEQIRNLHRTNPAEWTFEALSDSFPALPDMIKKVATSNWTKTKQQKIENHDVSVQKNWAKFKSGQYPELPQHLVDHLKKFTSRASNFNSLELDRNVSELEPVKIAGKKSEFSDIITSYEKLKRSKTAQEVKIDDKSDRIRLEAPPTHETYLTSKIVSKKLVTLDAFKKTIETRVRRGKSIEEDDKAIVVTSTPMNESKLEQSHQDDGNIVVVGQDKYVNNTSSTNSVSKYVRKTERDLSHLNYPVQITIPKDIYKRGSTYRLNDCYYDDDGEFLYRVPGMG